MYQAKSYRPNLSTLDNIPLADVAEVYLSLIASSKESRRALREQIIEDLKRDFNNRWNGTHEAPYEGDYEEMRFDEQADARIGTVSGLGTSEQLEFNIYVEDFAKKYGIQANAESFFSQMISRFGSIQVDRNENGLVSAKKMLNSIIHNRALLGLVVLSRYSTRSVLIKGQTDPKLVNYCALVPLFMSAFKKYNKIQYSSWDPSEIYLVTEPKLAETMLLTKEQFGLFSAEDALDARSKGLLIKSGQKMGSMRNPATTYSIYVPAESPLAPLPGLAKIMACQTWCAHPSNRTNLMILNPLDWDNIPEPLISTDVTSSTGTVFQKKSAAPVTADDWA